MRASSTFWFLFVVSTIVGFGNSQLLRDLPAEIISDILTILITGTVELIGNCTGADDGAPETNYWIYATNDENVSDIVSEPSAEICRGRTRISFLIHGWNGYANASYIIEIKNAYQARYDDACIISVNWGAYANQNYQSAYCALPGVASNVADFICGLHSYTNVSLETFHVVGHSLGGQVSGIAGYLVPTRCGAKIGRITGLDPAGPLYDGIATKDRLDPSDALFVDVIHTNEGQLGYLGSCGQLDSFANCGFEQPGCLPQAITGDAVNITALLDISFQLLICSHQRSCALFAESITSDRFVASECIGCGFPICKSSTTSKERKVIGEDDTTTGDVRNYVFYTNAQSPYAQGQPSIIETYN